MQTSGFEKEKVNLKPVEWPDFKVCNYNTRKSADEEAYHPPQIQISGLIWHETC